MWMYDGFEFTSDDIGTFEGFVYKITNKQNGRMYIGKKNFWNVRRLPPLKGKKRRRVTKIESDWQKYYGSSDEVKSLVEELGPENFEREILHLCRSKGEMSYYELKEQIDREVLFKEEYYNEFVGAKIHSKHVKDMKSS